MNYVRYSIKLLYIIFYQIGIGVQDLMKYSQHVSTTVEENVQKSIKLLIHANKNVLRDVIVNRDIIGTRTMFVYISLNVVYLIYIFIAQHDKPSFQNHKLIATENDRAEVDHCTGDNEIFTECKLPCGQKCEDLGRDIQCNTLTCTPGCDCRPGFYRNSKDECVPASLCGTFDFF